MDYDKIDSRHKRLEHDNNFVPEEGQPDLLCRNKESCGCPSLGVRKNTLPPETIQALRELGEILRRIHNRMISDGYIIKDGVIIKPDANKRTTNQKPDRPRNS